MAAQTRSFKATCICGGGAHEISVRSEDIPLKAYMCHCDSCRHLTGSLCLTVTFMPAYYEPKQSLVDRLTGFAFSKRITQYFCPTCGCHMLARCLADGNDPDSEATWGVTTGTLEHIEDILEWQGHEHIQDTMDGGFSDMLLEVNGKRLQRWPAHFSYHNEPSDTTDAVQEVTVYEQVHPQSTPAEKLRGHCKCGGVDFHVARPSARSALAKKLWPRLPSLEDVNESDLPDETELFWLRDHGTKFLAGLCACNSCRLASGTETTFWAFIPTVDLSVGKDGAEPFTSDFGTLKKYTSSNGCYRYFCSTCGATCFYDADDRMFMKDVAVGLLAAEGARAESWLGWRTNCLGYKQDSIPRATRLAFGIEKGLQAWEQHRTGEDLSGPIRTGGAL